MADEEQQCIFCHIATGKIPAKKVYEDDKVTAVLDINPSAPGHILVIPKEHVAIMPQMSEDLVAYLGMIAKQLSHALIRALKIEGTSIFVANGVAAGQRAPHFLLHVIPRSPNDNIALQPPVVKLDQKTTDAIYDKLLPAVSKQFGKEPPKRAEKPKVEEKKEEKKSRESVDSRELENAKRSSSENPQKKEAPKAGLDKITEFLAGGK